MTAAEALTLWLRLKAAGLVTGEIPPASTTSVPWFVRVMLGVAGWIGAVFLLLFVGFGFEFVMESASVSLIVGFAVCTAAGALFHSRPDSDFATQFGLAVSLAGQALVLFALVQMSDHIGAVALIMSLFQALLFITVPNFVHRIWAAWTGASAAVVALSSWYLQASATGLLSVACAWIWLNEFQFAKHGTTLRAGGYGLVLALISTIGLEASTIGVWLWHVSIDQPEDVYLWIAALWIGVVLSGIALLWTAWRLLIREAVEATSSVGAGILIAGGILALTMLKAPGLAPASLLMLLGYGNGNRVLFGLGVVTLLGYLFFYYYSLEITLLSKSILMAATGLALLATRFLLHVWWPAPLHHEAHHA